MGPGPERGRAEEAGQSPAPTEEKRKDGWGIEASAGPARAQARAGPGRGCWQDRGRLRGRGDGAAGWEEKCAHAARGPSAAGQVLLSPSFAGTCGLGWAPPTVGIRAAAEGQTARHSAGRSPASSAMGLWGPGFAALSAGERPRRGFPIHSQLFFDFPPTSLPEDGKVCKARVRKSLLFWVGVL